MCPHCSCSSCPPKAMRRLALPLHTDLRRSSQIQPVCPSKAREKPAVGPRQEFGRRDKAASPPTLGHARLQAESTGPCLLPPPSRPLFLSFWKASPSDTGRIPALLRSLGCPSAFRDLGMPSRTISPQMCLCDGGDTKTHPSLGQQPAPWPCF